MSTMKKVISIMLTAAMILSLSVPIASATTPTYHAQVLHASGVNDYGTNIHDSNVSSSLTDVPLSIVQTDGSLQISGTLDGHSILIQASPRGKNSVENMVYFNTVNNNDDSLSVLTIMYLDSFSDAAIITDEYDSSATSVLKIYLKNTSTSEKEYYFLEIFDFSYENFNSVISTMDVCESDHWNSKEFLPIEVSDKEDEISVCSLDKTRTITEKYVDPSNLTFNDTMKVLLVHDIQNVARTGTTTWIHTIKIVDKYSVCIQDSSFSDYTGCPMQLRNVYLRTTAPKNTAFITTNISGVITKLANVTVSASIGIVLSAKLASVSLSGSYSPAGTVNVNNTFTAYTNSNSSGYTRNIKTALGTQFVLRKKGDKFVVTNQLKNYGSGSTSAETVYGSWNWTTNHYMNNTNTNGVQTDSTSCRVV